MVSTWARMVRVLNIQASEATTSAITSVVICCTLPAIMTRMAMAGTVIRASATTRIVPSTGPRKLPAISPSTVPAPTPMNPASSPIFSVFGVANIRRVSMSRPCASVPSRNSVDGRCRGITDPTSASRGSTNSGPTRLKSAISASIASPQISAVEIRPSP